jgi:hypothetical protein
MLKQTIGRICLAVLLLYGFIPFLFGYYYFLVPKWAAERIVLVACGAIFTLTGATMLASGVCLLGNLTDHRTAAWAGGTASILSGAVLLGASFSRILPCSGPD